MKQNIFFGRNHHTGGYRVSAYCPDGYGIPGGNANIDFSIYSDTKETRITRFVLSVYSGGKKPDEDNYNIEWHEDYVIITVFDEGTRDVENGMLD